MQIQYERYEPKNDAALVNELSLEIVNGSMKFVDYIPFQSQIDMVYNRFINEQLKIFEKESI